MQIVLVEPRQPRNIGSVIRAAANFGIKRVCLVGVDQFSAEIETEVRIASSGSWDIIELQLTKNLPDALAESTMVIGATARSRQSAIPVISGITELHDNLGGSISGMTSLVFGRESNGLTNEETQQCHYLLTLSVSPEFPSLNLAQAVAVVASQWYASRKADTDTSENPPCMASPRIIESFIARLGVESDPEVAGQLRRLFHRAEATDGDLALLFNLLKSQR